MRILPSLFLLTLSSALTAQVVIDDFNRADSSNMGPNWSEQSGDLKIKNQQGEGVFAFSNNWMSHNGYSADYTQAYASVSFHNNGNRSGAVGLAIGLDVNTWSAVSIKLQDNDGDKLFDRLFFEAAINAGAWFNQPTPVFYDLASPMAEGSLSLSAADADTAEVSIYDAGGFLVATYQATGITQGSVPPPKGTSVAVRAYSQPIFDDFVAGGNAATETIRLGSPANPNAFGVGVTNRPIIGKTWDPIVDHSTFMPAALIDLLVIAEGSANLSTGLGTLLVDTSTPLFLYQAIPAGTSFQVAIPNDVSFVGLDYYAQAASGDGTSVQVTNGIDVLTGSY